MEKITSQDMTSSYNSIIANAFEQAKELAEKSGDVRNIAGFCQLKGPTGGGKTSSLYRQQNDLTPAALEYLKNNNVPVIFSTHRWNILQDTYANVVKQLDSQGNTLTASVIYAQDENITNAVCEKPMQHEQGVKGLELPNTNEALERIRELGGFETNEDFSWIKQNCQRIYSLSKYLEGKISVDEEYRKEIKLNVSRLCSAVDSAVLKALGTIKDKADGTQKNYGEGHELTKQAWGRYQEFRQNPWVRRVLPAIAWHDDKQHVLILTTQKLFSSFYDGERKVRLSSSSLAGKIIFIDEFDYQAEVLKSLLARSQEIKEPLECLFLVLLQAPSLLERLAYQQTEQQKEVIEGLHDYLATLKDTLDEKGLDLFRSRALINPLSERENLRSFKKQYLFRSDHMITSESIWLNQTDAGLEVSQQKTDPNAVDMRDLLRLVEKNIRRLSLILSEQAYDEAEKQQLIRKLFRSLFDPTNDYQTSYYTDTLTGLNGFALPKADLSELRAVAESNLLPNSHANLYGLTCWSLGEKGYIDTLDSHRLHINRAYLPTTPEGLLVSLASRNLVFALSATSYMERAIGNFDLRWVNNALRYVADARDKDKTQSFLGNVFTNRPNSWFKKPIPYVQSVADFEKQQQVVEALKVQKDKQRGTKLNTHRLEFEEATERQDFNELLNHLSDEFFDIKDEEKQSSVALTHRRKIILWLLETLEKAVTNREHKGHLVFVNSLKYFKKWLVNNSAQASRNSMSWFQLESNEVLDCLNIPKQLSKVFLPVRIHETPLILCLLDAETQKTSGFENTYQAVFNGERAVVVLTQNASATNGINLDYELFSTGQTMDLTALYILEAKHFYFPVWNRKESEIDEMAHAGMKLRDLEKLVRASEFSHQDRIRHISSIMNNTVGVKQLNNEYKKTSDYIKNLAADVQQQVGRVERSWSSVPKISIYIESSIAIILRKFAETDICAMNRTWISPLNNQLLDDLLAMQDTGALQEKLSTPVQNGQGAKQMIDGTLVAAIHKARDCEKTFKDVSVLWDQLGKAILRYDLLWKYKDKYSHYIAEPLKDWACFRRPEKSQQTGQVWYNRDSWQFFSTGGEGRIRYQPEDLYKVVQNHPDIVDWFNYSGYRISLYPTANSVEEKYALHPEVVQRLLQGRIGEEAIRALFYAEQLKTTCKTKYHNLFELYDFEVKGSSYFIDAKYWSTASLNRADNNYLNWLESGQKKELAPLSVIEKVKCIQLHQGAESILVVANLVTEETDAKLMAFDENLKPCLQEDASILCLSGCLTRTGYRTTSGFNQLVRLIKQNI